MAVQIVGRAHNSVTYVGAEDGKTIVGERANVSGNLDRVQRMRHAAINSAVMGQCQWSIPMPALAAWCNGLGIDVHEALSNDAVLDRFKAEHGKFKVRGGWQ